MNPFAPWAIVAVDIGGGQALALAVRIEHALAAGASPLLMPATLKAFHGRGPWRRSVDALIVAGFLRRTEGGWERLRTRPSEVDEDVDPALELPGRPTVEIGLPAPRRTAMTSTERSQKSRAEKAAREAGLVGGNGDPLHAQRAATLPTVADATTIAADAASAATQTVARNGHHGAGRGWGDSGFGSHFAEKTEPLPIPTARASATADVATSVASTVARSDASAARDDFDFAAVRIAYAEGITAATANPYTPPRGREEERMLQAMAEYHGAPRRGAELYGWVRATASAYVRAVGVDDRKFQCGFSPSKCVEWLNAGRPGRGSRGRPGAAKPQPGFTDWLARTPKPPNDEAATETEKEATG